jgi:hypothetical protein
LRTRISAIAFGICAAALAACGGGGGGVPHPTNTSFRPAANGDAFNYAGTMTETFVRPPLGPGSFVTPSPNPTNSQTLTTAVTQAVTVSSVSSFQGVANPFDFHVLEDDTLNGGLKTSTITSDDYYTYTTSGSATTIASIGSNVTSSDGSTFLTVLGSGNGLVDILPEVAGAISPANNAAETVTETDADGSTDTKAVNADGTYTENGTFDDGTTLQAVVNADGSGSDTFPLILPTDSSYSVSAPSGGNITITINFAAPLLGGGPEPTPFTVPVWYPLPVVLSQETNVDSGAATLPAGCDVPAGLKKTAHQLVDTKSTVDPVFGELDTTTTTTYTEPGIGVACVQLNDVLQQFYDLSGQTQFTLDFQNTPLQTTTTAETLGITSKTVKGLMSIGSASQIAFQAGISRFHAQLAHERLERRIAFRQALVARYKLKGGHL